MKPTADQTAKAGSEPIRAQVISNPFPDQSPPTTSHNVVNSAGAVADPAATAPAQSLAGQSPLSAADADLIEKNWVDVIESTIKQLEDDPYALQIRQSELSRDYLKKRFNLDVGQS